MKKLYFLIIGVLLNVETFAQCSDIFFSEYIEGSSNNKAVEIYNPTSNTIDLSNYVFYRFNNGGVTASDSFKTTATLAPNEVYVIGNPSAIASILAQSDTTHTFTFYNGDDALCIVSLVSGDTLDIFGIIGNDPGTNWPVGTGATSEFTLVRKSTVKAGQKDWSVGATEWDVYAQNTDTYIGSHTSDCHVPSTPVVAFKAGTMKVNEGDGTVNIEVSISGASTSMATSVTVSITGGTAVSGTDYSSALPTTLTFPAGSSDDKSVSIDLTDNFNLNDDLTVEFSLSNVSSHAVLGNDSVITLTIADDDYQVANIKDLIVYDADLAPENKDKKYQVKGIVYGIDFDGNAGLSFTLIDETAGINIFNFNDVSDYVVTEGDEITARGHIDFYNGLLELFVDSIKVESTGNALMDPIEVSAPSENTESKFIKLSKVWVADTTTVWPNNGNVWLTNSDADTFQIRIDRDASDIVGVEIAYDTMTIMGLGGQFDNSAPYNEGYQIFPRRLSDIQEYKDKSSVKDLSIRTSVYPNPANNNITVSGKEKWTTYEIYNTVGVKVAEGTLQNNNIEIANLIIGNYFLKLGSDNNVGSARFVIVR